MKSIVLFAVVFYPVTFAVTSAWAAKGKTVISDLSLVESAAVSIKISKKKSREYAISCYNGLPGRVKTTKKGAKFISYKVLGRKKPRGSKKRRLFLKIFKAGKKACTGDNPGVPASLESYKGPWTAAQAQILYDRFCFGGSPEEIAWSVANGMNATINRLTTWVAEPGLDGAIRDVTCDTYLKAEEHPNEHECNHRNPNDFSFSGFRQGLIMKMKGQNCFFGKLWFFLHDERMAASASSLRSYRRHCIEEHADMLWRAAQTGDYTQFMREWNKDCLGNWDNLDGGNNDGVNGPNENYAREFWELGTLGPLNLDGGPQYGVADIAGAALAHSGGTWTSVEVDIGGGDDAYVEYPAFSDSLHAPGAKTIFIGTPYQTQVNNAEDVLRATFAHPGTSEHLAYELLKEFVLPNPSDGTVRKLAKDIRDSGFNITSIMKKLMAAKEQYESSNAKSLLKHPVDLLLGFLRQTGYPVNHRKIDSYLEDLGQQPLKAPTIFGWDEDKLVPRNVIAWRNVVIDLMNRGSSLEDEDNYSLYNNFIAGLPASIDSPTVVLIRSLMDRFNVPNLTPAQVAQIDQYLNFDLDVCNSDWKVNAYGCVRQTGSQPRPENYYMIRNALDLHPDGGFETKLQGAIGVILMYSVYGLK